ncbi:hypothetical protein [Brachyspira pilosicoli]|uniref:hypothetical protein n=1 Tax=Brachyspira pilosicoli TaxID=52584 RepID=UPI003004D611
MALDYDSFLKWALIKEPSLKEKEPLNELPEDIIPSGISDYTYQQTTMAFKEALNRCASLKRYMRDFNYINLIFNYALHISIVSSAFEIKKDDEGKIWNEPTEPLQQLYVQYSVYDTIAGILTSTSSGGSSASSTLPKSLTEGDLETSYLLSTPYGVQAEIYFEQVNGIII